MEVIFKFVLNILFLWAYGMGSIAIYSKLSDFCEYKSSVPFWFAYFAFTLSIPMYLIYYNVGSKTVFQALVLIWVVLPFFLNLLRGNAK